MPKCRSPDWDSHISNFHFYFSSKVYGRDSPTKTKMSWNDVYISHFCQVVSSAKRSSMGVPFLRRGNPYCNSLTSQMSQRKQIPGGWRCPSPMGWDRKPPWDDVWSRGSSEVWWCCGVFYPQQLEEHPWIIHMHLNYDMPICKFQVWNVSNKSSGIYPHRRKLFSRFFPVIHQSSSISWSVTSTGGLKWKNSTYSVCLHVFSNFGRHYCVRYACFWCIQKASCLMEHPTETCGNMCPLDSDATAFLSRAKIQWRWTWTSPTLSI